MNNTPEWLSKRDGGVVFGLNNQTMVVTLNGHPLYRLSVVPAAGKFTCAIMQSNNAKRLDANNSYDSVTAALEGGLEELRKKLGW